MIHFQEKYYIEIFDSSRVIPPPHTPTFDKWQNIFFSVDKTFSVFRITGSAGKLTDGGTRRKGF